jgi:hypothetical protein
MLTRALGSAAVTLVILSATGCSEDTEASEAAASNADTFAEFFVTSSDGFVFERVDRETPDSLEATEGQTCFTDPAWLSSGAPYDRGDRRFDLPAGTQRGQVNVMKQCALPSRT